MKSILFSKSFIILFLSMLSIIFACKQEELYSSKEADERELASLRAEIQKMSDQVKCENAGDWKIVPIGSKSCGGATSFAVYSINLDTELFLQKIAHYNSKQKAFNVKWGLISDCSIIVPPKSIICENGKPKLIY